MLVFITHTDICIACNVYCIYIYILCITYTKNTHIYTIYSKYVIYI